VILSLGPDLATGLARALGDLYRRLDKRHREVTEDNVRHAFPEMPDAEVDRVVRISFRGLVLGIVEFLYLDRYMSARSITHRVSAKGFDRARAAVGDGGAVFAGGHFGNWEVLGASMGMLGVPLNSVARPIDNPLVDRWLLGLRTRFGQRIVAKERALRTLIRIVREGGFLGILADQDAGRHGIFVEFMGRPASTIPTPAALAVRLGVPLITGGCHRVPGRTFHFHMELDEPIFPRPDADRNEEIERLTTEVNRSIERRIREHPEQYLWQHRRWKTRPPEESGKKPRKGARWNRT